MHVKLIEGKKLPRLICIPFCTKDNYRALQAGKTIDIGTTDGNKLIKDGFCIEVKKAIPKGGDQ